MGVPASDHAEIPVPELDELVDRPGRRPVIVDLDERERRAESPDRVCGLLHEHDPGGVLVR